MKIKLFLWIICIAAVFTACKDRDAEKKIAALEAKISELEGKKTVAPAEQTQPADQKPEGPLPVITFEKVEHDFGTIREGQEVEYIYKFKNTGEAPLIVQNAQPSCGCTVPDWSKEPIPVGGEGFVKALFDSKGKPGLQNKTVTVFANTWPKTTKLSFKAMVTASSESKGPTK